MSDHRTIWMYGAGLGFIVLFGIGAVQAHEGARGIVKQRMDVMKDMGVLTQSLSARGMA